MNSLIYIFTCVLAAFSHGVIGLDDTLDEGKIFAMMKKYIESRASDADKGRSGSTGSEEEKIPAEPAKVWLKNQANGWQWEPMKHSQLPSSDKVQHLFAARGGLAAIPDSRTEDVLQIGGNGPFDVEFRDRHNNDWYVRIYQAGQSLSFMVPCGSKINWHSMKMNLKMEAAGVGPHRGRTGHEEPKDAKWAALTFGFLSGGARGKKDGVWMRFVAYKYVDQQLMADDARVLDKIFKYVGQGLSFGETMNKVQQNEVARGIPIKF